MKMIDVELYFVDHRIVEADRESERESSPCCRLANCRCKIWKRCISGLGKQLLDMLTFVEYGGLPGPQHRPEVLVYFVSSWSTL